MGQAYVLAFSSFIFYSVSPFHEYKFFKQKPEEGDVASHNPCCVREVPSPNLLNMMFSKESVVDELSR